MGWAGDKKKPAKGGGWQKSGPGRSKPRSQYGWQEKARDAASLSKASRRRYESKWVIFSALGAVLLGLFLVLLLINTPRTPLLLVTGLDYAAPAPPNSWALEDHEALVGLQKAFEVQETPHGPPGPESARRVAFKRWIEEHKRLRRGFLKIGEPLVIYFRLPGVVDENKKAFLLPPGTSPLSDDDQWWSIESILEQIQKLPPERTKLLIFDSNQHVVNWRMGLAYNTFQERLTAEVADSAISNLAVLTAAGPGQKSWAAAELGGSSFGQFLQLGLAGEADGANGDSDQKVTLQELANYLKREVGGWVQVNRGAAQEPTLLPETGDFFLSHALDDDEVAVLREKIAKPAILSPHVKIDEIAALWQNLAELSEADILRYDPLALGDYQNRLLRLEQLARGGEGYRTQANEEASALRKELKTALAIKLENEGSAALADQWRIFDNDNAAATRESNLSSLPLREYFDQADPADSKQTAALWNRLVETTGEKGPVANEAIGTVRDTDVELVETQLLIAAHHQGVLSTENKKASDLADLVALSQRAQGLAVPRSASGLPGDERAHYYVREQLADAEPRRRKAEDLLFIEEATSRELSDFIGQAKASYTRTEQTRDAVTKTLATVDRAWGETALIAEWLCLPQGSGALRLNENQTRVVVADVQGYHNLGRDVGDMERLRGAVSPESLERQIATLTSRSQEIETKAAQRSQFFLNQYKDLGAAEVGSEIFAIEAALACPLVSAATDDKETGRQKLWKLRDALAKQLHEKYFAPGGGAAGGFTSSSETSEADEPSAEEEQGPTLLAAIAGRERSPLLAVLDLPTPAGVAGERSDANKLDLINAAARAGLIAAARLVLSSGDSASDGKGDDAALEDRAALAQAERRARMAAPFLAESPKDDPIAELRRFDLQQLMLWHSERALDDFWHRVTRNNPKSIDDLRVPYFNIARDPPKPMFDEIAAEYLNIAERLRTPPTPGVGRQIASLKALKRDRQNASRYGMSLNTEPYARSEAEGQFDLEVTAAPHPKGSRLPSGMAAVFVADLDNQRLPSRRLAGNAWGRLDVPLSTNDPQRLEARITGGKNAEILAVGFYRGQQYRERFSAPDPQIAQVAYEWPKYARQSVRLVGDAAKPPAVIFILDCSESMNKEVTLETGGTSNRLQEAVSALQTILRQIAGSQRIGEAAPQVGVYFFGHRLKWKRTIKPNRPNLESIDINRGAGGGPLPPNMSPAEDVERVLPLGDFGEFHFGQIRARLTALKPWGYTPVYLSIRQALDSFPQNDDEHNPSIIVITDGANQQPFEHQYGFTSIELKETTLRDVKDRWTGQGGSIPIHIIGFGDLSNAKQAVKDFRGLSEDTGGEFLEARSSGELLATLRDRLDVSGYSVVGPRGKSLTGEPSGGKPGKEPLNKQVTVPLLKSSPPIEVQVLFEDMAGRVMFEGGEELVFKVGPGGFEGIPYSKPGDVTERLVRGTGGAGVSQVLRIHEPQRAAGNVAFRFSVQDEESYFTPRPQMIWAEIQPEAKNSSQAADLTYIFYDRVFQPREPVPLVKFTLSNWPAEVKDARVNFWCSYEEPKSTGDIPLRTVLGRDNDDMQTQQEPRTGVEVGAILSKKSDDGAFTVLVKEVHPQQPATLDAIRVWLDISDSAIRPKSVSHSFDASSGVRHVYQFANQGMAESEFARKITIRYGPGSAIKESALQLRNPRGVVVRIGDGEAIHGPTVLGP